MHEMYILTVRPPNALEYHLLLEVPPFETDHVMAEPFEKSAVMVPSRLVRCGLRQNDLNGSSWITAKLNLDQLRQLLDAANLGKVYLLDKVV